MTGRRTASGIRGAVLKVLSGRTARLVPYAYGSSQSRHIGVREDVIFLRMQMEAMSSRSGAALGRASKADTWHESPLDVTRGRNHPCQDVISINILFPSLDIIRRW